MGHKSAGALLLLLLVVSESRVLPEFRCSTESMTSFCNSLKDDILVRSCNTTECTQCLNLCNITSNTGSVCPSQDCLRSLCSPYYALVLDSLISCQEVYGPDYCSLCETCLSPDIPGRGDLDNICELNYLSLFCRLLPQNFSTCTNQFSDEVCNYCYGYTKLLCNPLSQNQLTSTQVNTLCLYNKNICLPYSLRQTCTYNAFNATVCAYCRYTLTNSICPTLPNCSSEIGLVCRVLISDYVNCFIQYNNDICTYCISNYLLCGSIDQSVLSLNQVDFICNSITTSVCSSVISMPLDNCSSLYSIFNCTLCHGIQDICMATSGSGNNISCYSDEALKCAFVILYYPCNLLFGRKYCSECDFIVEFCNFNDFNQSIISTIPVCQYSTLVSLCHYVQDVPDCISIVSKYTCDLCALTSNCTTFNADINLLCSSQSAQLCSNLINSNGNCTSLMRMNDCNFCHAQAVICSEAGSGSAPVNYTISSGMSIDCYEASSLFCRLMSPNCTTQSSPTCKSCLQPIVSCPPLTANQLLSSDIMTLCSSFNETCLSLKGNYISNYSLCLNIQSFFCDFCYEIEPYCQQNAGLGSGSGSINCIDDTTFLCNAITTNISECNAEYSDTTCSNCQDYLLQCENDTTAFSLTDFCTSFLTISMCASVPIGDGCYNIRYQNDFVCDQCSYYAQVCPKYLCTYDFVEQCYIFTSKRFVPNLSFNDSIFEPLTGANQCLPCSLAFALCKPLESGSGMNTSFGSNITSSSGSGSGVSSGSDSGDSSGSDSGDSGFSSGDSSGSGIQSIESFSNAVSSSLVISGPSTTIYSTSFSSSTTQEQRSSVVHTFTTSIGISSSFSMPITLSSSLIPTLSVSQTIPNIDIDDLSTEERDNSVTLVFNGLTVSIHVYKNVIKLHCYSGK